MIIETAIPEIEDEANSLLEKLTEGRMTEAPRKEPSGRRAIKRGSGGTPLLLFLLWSSASVGTSLPSQAALRTAAR